MEHYVWNANHILLEIGSIQLYWYGLLFVGSFIVGLHILTWIYKREGRDPEILETLFVYIIAGAAIGARFFCRERRRRSAQQRFQAISYSVQRERGTLEAI
jgi:prolipoprotein diacylglyceryltransferase